MHDSNARSAIRQSLPVQDRHLTEAEPAPGGAAEVRGTISFGPFCVHRARRLIERNGEVIPLGSRAFDILVCLLEHAGQVVEKTELLRRVWPNSIVEEGSLRFHINALRKALGEGRYIANIAGQGYSFVAPVSSLPSEQPGDIRSTPARPLPARPRRLVGRDGVLKTLAEQLLEHRFVTVVGPGGVGKTSVAVALAHDLASHFDGDTCFFDVGSVFNPELLAGGLASALGVTMQPTSATPSVTTFLRGRRMLLVLDGCEPSVDAAAALAEQIVREAPQVHILATSREALRAEGEHVHGLFPLEYPAPGGGQTVETALGFGAVQLFVERAASSLHGFVLTDEEAPLVSMICRKLDGLALAIELAAGRIGTYGVLEVARQLESQFALMWPARRTAIARQQTLSATLGWSYRLLTTREQLVFRRLGVFTGVFTLEMAAAVAADEEVSQRGAMELLGSLVSKSLVQFKMEGSYASYHLLDTTRSYAFEKLGEANEVRWMKKRHAGLILSELAEECGIRNGHLERRGDILEDVGAAIEWALSPEGDLETGAALAAASAPIWLQAGLLVECRYWMARVLDSVDAPRLDAHKKLSIQAALASAATFTGGFTSDSFSSWLSAFEIAKSLGNIEQQLTCIIVLWAHKVRAPRYDDALSLAFQADELATMLSDRGTRALADWLLGVTYHRLGRLALARPHLDRCLAGDTLEARQGMMKQFGYDRRIPTLGVLSNLHWLEGRPDQAFQLGIVTVSEARHSPYPVPLCEALSWHAFNLYLRGDDPGQLDDLLDEAIAHARRHFIDGYVGLAMALKGLNAVRVDLAGTTLVSEALGLMSKSNYEVFHPYFLTELAKLQIQSGMRLHDADLSALLRLETGHAEDWATAEVKRNLGEILLFKGEESRAMQLFCDAASCAERQGALAWSLRVALSLARSAVDRDSRHQARARLQGLVERFTEGKDTADLRAASLFLATL